MPDAFVRPDPTSPTAVAEAQFSTMRKGYRPDEVRLVLREVATEISRLQSELSSLSSSVRPTALSATGGPQIRDLDDDTVRQVLGEEMVKVLQTAREAAAEVLARGEQNAAQLIREASTQAAAVRHEAEVEVARLRAEAAAQIQTDLDRAREQGREMVAEAQAYRDRLMAEASRKRDAVREQIDRLLDGRDRLVDVFTRAERAAAEVLGELGPTSGRAPGVDDDADGVVPEPSALAVEAPAPTSGPAPFDAALDEDFAPDIAPDIPPSDTAPESDNEGVVVELFAGAPSDQTPAADQAPAPRAVDDIFSRLRAEVVPPVADSVEPESAEPESETELEALAEDSPIGQREAAVVPLIASAARRVKRVLADEQNAALGMLRDTVVASVGDLVAEASAHVERYVTAMLADLTKAYKAGGAAGGLTALSDTDQAKISTFVAESLIEPLRSRLDRAVLDGGGDADDMIRSVRAVYREWKTQHIDEHLDDVLRLAYGLGVLAGAPAGATMCWVLDPRGTPCADAEDNSLAGAVPAGADFPTGHSVAPAYPGCRCLVTPASS